MSFARGRVAGGLALPEGRAGQLAAMGLTALGILVLWLGMIAPVVSWYGARERQIAAMSRLVVHERALIGRLAQLRDAVAELQAKGHSAAVLLAGRSDAVAGARLQGMVQGLAHDAGITLDSEESMAGVPTGGFRRIPLRVTMTTSYRRLIALLGAIAQARPRMLVDDLGIHATGVPDAARDLPVRAAFTVSAFRVGGLKDGAR